MRAEIGILLFFILTSIDMCFGFNTKIWNQFYYVKENLICLFLLAIIYQKSFISSEKLLIIGSIIFFSLRIVFNLFFYEYSNDWHFGAAFICIITAIVAGYKFIK